MTFAACASSMLVGRNRAEGGSRRGGRRATCSGMTMIPLADRERRSRRRQRLLQHVRRNAGQELGRLAIAGIVAVADDVPLERGSWRNSVP